MSKLTTLAQIAIRREAVQLQMEGNEKLLKAACLLQNHNDIRHLMDHSHALLNQHNHLQVEYYNEYRKQMGL